MSKIIIPKGKLRSHFCSCCSGSGEMKCPRCDGYGTFNDKSTCYYCQGSGKVTCSACNGKGYFED